MYSERPQNDLASGAIAAATGAGVATSFAVAMGQSPWIAMGIVAFATVVALACDRLGLVD